MKDAMYYFRLLIQRYRKMTWMRELKYNNKCFILLNKS